MREGHEDETGRAHDEGALVEIGNYPTPVDGAMAKARLEAHGIEGILFDTELATSWVYTNALGGVRLMVAARVEEEARAALGAPTPEGPAADAGHDITPERPETWCPACHAQDVETLGEPRRGWLARLFSPGAARRCRTCGHVWRTFGKAYDNA